MKLILSFALFLFVALCCAQINAEDEKPFSCTPNEPFDKDCHYCECSASGAYAVCTGFTCDSENKSIRLKAPENCKDEDKWSDGCNDCFCSKGIFACTRSSCSIILGVKPADVETQEPTA